MLVSTTSKMAVSFIPHRPIVMQRPSHLLRAPFKLSSIQPQKVERVDSFDASIAPEDMSTKSPEVAFEDLMPPGANEENKNRIARYSGTKLAKRKIREVEGERPLGEYMALPVSQYSVLDAARIERLDENTFKCYIGSFKMFAMTVEPILTVSVVANEKGCEIKLLDCELDGSRAAKAANGVFTSRLTNIVSWEQDEDGKMLTSDVTIEISGITPRYMSFVPTRVIEAVGNTLMQQIINISVPQFLKQLEKDYTNWAKGDDTRSAIGTGEWDSINDKVTEPEIEQKISPEE